MTKTTMHNRAELDFDHIERLRKHFLLSQKSMAALAGVSRITYHGWVQGQGMRATNYANMKIMLRKMLVLMRDKNWPPADLVDADQEQRLAITRSALLKL